MMIEKVYKNIIIIYEPKERKKNKRNTTGKYR